MKKIIENADVFCADSKTLLDKLSKFVMSAELIIRMPAGCIDEVVLETPSLTPVKNKVQRLVYLNNKQLP